MDTSGDGSLSYFEFVEKCNLNVGDSKDLDNVVVSHITTTLYRSEWGRFLAIHRARQAGNASKYFKSILVA